MMNQEKLEILVFSKKVPLKINKKKQIHIDNFYLSLNEKIGSGAYSDIYKLTDFKHNVHLALKIEKGNLPREDKISRQVFEKGCETVNQRYIGNLDNENYYLMNLAEGTLQDLKEKKDLKNNKNKAQFFKAIAENIRKQLICLFELGYVYTDIKLDNIFYDFRDNLRFFLGDLGSAVPDDENYYISSYPPPEKRQNNENGIFTLHEKKYEEILSWGIGIILFLLMNNETEKNNEFFFTQKLSNRFHENSIIKMNAFYGKGYGKYLSKNPRQRPSIYETIV